MPYTISLALDEPIEFDYSLASIALAALDVADDALASLSSLSISIDDASVEVDAGLDALADSLRRVSDSDDDDATTLDSMRRDASLLSTAIDDLVRAKRQRTANRERATTAFYNATRFARLADALDDEAFSRFTSIATDEPTRDDAIALRLAISKATSIA